MEKKKKEIGLKGMPPLEKGCLVWYDEKKRRRENGYKSNK